MTKSNITGKTYDPSNSSVAYISNLQQVFRYLCNGAEDDLVDILYANTKNNCLVFVFRKSDNIRRLYDLWNKHELK